MLENSTYSVISPEGAASIIMERCFASKASGRIDEDYGPDLQRLGIIDEIIPEVKGGAHRNINEQANAIEAVLQRVLPEFFV